MPKEVDRLGKTFGAGFGNIYPIAAVMLRCAAEVPAVHSMYRPRASFVGRFVDEDFGAGRS